MPSDTTDPPPRDGGGAPPFPEAKTICIDVSHKLIHEIVLNTNMKRAFITCYRCGEQGHYRSECPIPYCFETDPTMCRGRCKVLENRGT